SLLRGDLEAVFGDLLLELQEADFTVVNLECVLTTSTARIPKVGPHFKAHPWCAKGLREAGIDLINLANNHIKDFGEAGIEETTRSLRANGIEYFGAGRGLEEAARPASVQLYGTTIAFIGMAESEFSIAGPSSWGANPIDLIQWCNTLSDLRSKGSL